MAAELRLGGVGPRGLYVGPPRTQALLLGFLLAVVGWLAPPTHAEVEINLLGEVVLMEGDTVGGGELEASMRSSFLQDFQEATEEMRRSGEAQQNEATPTVFPDSSAVVGRIFQIKVPNKMEDLYLGDIVKVSHRVPPLSCRNTAPPTGGCCTLISASELPHSQMNFLSADRKFPHPPTVDLLPASC